MTNTNLTAARAMLQNLLDTYQVRDVGMVEFQNALVLIDGVIATPGPEPETIVNVVTGTDDVIAGVLAGLTGVISNVNALSSDVGTLIEGNGQLLEATAIIKAAVNGVEADTAAIRASVVPAQ